MPTGTIRPASSAMARNFSGRSRPRSGCCQRISASFPTVSPCCKFDVRLIVQHEFAALQGLMQVGDQGHVLLELGIQRRREELVVVRPFLLGEVHRHVGVLQQLTLPAVIQRINGDANACRGVDLLMVHQERPGR